MEFFESNIAFLKDTDKVKGKIIDDFLSLSQKSILSLTLAELTILSTRLAIQSKDLLYSNMAYDKSKLKKIKLLILDVDGVMTDGGMYFSEDGNQSKKYNTKDGMAIMRLTKSNFQVGIISSGFKINMVKNRADLLNIQHFYVGRGAKIDVLKEWCAKLNIGLDEVAMIGDDINDREVMAQIGISACPNDAVQNIKDVSDIILSKKGGEACVREFIDEYLLDSPIL